MTNIEDKYDEKARRRGSTWLSEKQLRPTGWSPCMWQKWACNKFIEKTCCPLNISMERMSLRVTHSVTFWMKSIMILSILSGQGPVDLKKINEADSQFTA